MKGCINKDVFVDLGDNEARTVWPTSKNDMFAKAYDSMN
jgi:hypothetical protein